MSEPVNKPDNPMWSILINIVIPVSILSFLSKDKYLGPVWALVVGLAFPVSFGLRTLIRSRKADWIALLGIISVTLTGVFGILQLPPLWVAVKEAAIPTLIGTVLLLSLKTRKPLIRTVLINEALFDLPRLNEALKARENESEFEQRLVGLTWGFAIAMFLSGVLSFILARIVLKSVPGSEAYTAELGKMTGLSNIVVLVPVMGIMLWVLNKLFDTLIELTGLDLEELLAEHLRKKERPETDPAEE
jgi:hypothetical protein